MNLFRTIFERKDIKLLVDPFGPGMDVTARIQSGEFHSLLFLSCLESRASTYCKAELATAKFKGIPVFVTRLPGDVGDLDDADLNRRIFLDLGSLSQDGIEPALHELAKELYARARLYRIIDFLGSARPPEHLRRAAQELADENEPAAVAEFVPQLDRAFRHAQDSLVRYLLARALGKTRVPDVRSVLLKWRSIQNHPLELEGIREALKMLD